MASRLVLFTRSLMGTRTLPQCRRVVTERTYSQEAAVDAAARKTLKRFVPQYRRTEEEGIISFEEFRAQKGYLSWAEFKESSYVKVSCDHDATSMEESFESYEELQQSEYKAYRYGGDGARMV